MYYKVLKNGKIIDVLDKLVYLEYNAKHDTFLLTNKNTAQAIFSSDRNHIWHVNNLLEIPVDGYDTVELETIDIYEYEKLKFELTYDVDKILEQYTLMLLERGVL